MFHLFYNLEYKTNDCCVGGMMISSKDLDGLSPFSFQNLTRYSLVGVLLHIFVLEIYILPNGRNNIVSIGWQLEGAFFFISSQFSYLSSLILILLLLLLSSFILVVLWLLIIFVVDDDSISAHTICPYCSCVNGMMDSKNPPLLLLKTRYCCCCSNQ